MTVLRWCLGFMCLGLGTAFGQTPDETSPTAGQGTLIEYEDEEQYETLTTTLGDGDSIELIIGESSKDGAAKRKRLPVVD